MGCPHSDIKILGISVNCPSCAMDRTLELFEHKQITEKQAWAVLKLVRDNSVTVHRRR